MADDPNRNSAEAARARMESNRNRNDLAQLTQRAGGIRETIINSFELVLWVVLVLGVLSAVISLFTFSPFEAIGKLVQTIAIVGVGFVVLDIRERLIGRT